MANHVLTGNDLDAIVDRRKDYRVRKSLRYSVFDGGFSAAMIGFGESFFVAYALFLKATTLQVALLVERTASSCRVIAAVLFEWTDQGAGLS